MLLHQAASTLLLLLPAVGARGGGGYTCTSVQGLQSVAHAVTSRCCDEPTEDCSSGAPATCNIDCAEVLLPAFSACQAGIFADPRQRQQFASIVDLFSAAASTCDAGGSGALGGGSEPSGPGPGTAGSGQAEQSSQLYMTLTKLDPEATAYGGRCLDGSMAGYYSREGTDPSLYVIWLEGGGGCHDEDACTHKAHHSVLGSSNTWRSIKDRGIPPTLNSDCSTNPDFCHATHVWVPYCTADLHQGNNTSPSDDTWGLWFDGHANFAAIVAELQQKMGLNVATSVLLMGSSAGGVGTFKNVDYLASQVPHATVKGAPDAGWFNPAALPTDLPDIYWPSDWAHFSTGQHGNAYTEPNTTVFIEHLLGTVYQGRGLFPPACIADQKSGQWWACQSIHNWYKYIESPLFIMEALYDTNQIFSGLGATTTPASSEEAVLLRYIEMFGEAMRTSTEQVLADAPLTVKSQPDGLFLPSCLAHATTQHSKHTPAGTPNIEIDGMIALTYLGGASRTLRSSPRIYLACSSHCLSLTFSDWFFERNQLPHRVVENCPQSAGGLPCNAATFCQPATWYTVTATPGPGPGRGGGGRGGGEGSGSTTATLMSCSTTHDLQGVVSVISERCCDEQTEDCTGGLPAVCNADCAEFLLPAFSACQAGIFADPQQRAQLAGAIQVFADAAANCPGGTWGGH